MVVVTTTSLDLSDETPREFVTRLRRLGAPMHAIAVPSSDWRYGRTEFPRREHRSDDFRAFALDEGPRQTGGRRIDLTTVNGLGGRSLG